MSRIRRYRSIEKGVYARITDSLKEFVGIVLSFFLRVFRLLDNRLTIMVVPHSKGGAINFETNVFSLILTGVLLLGGLISFVYMNKKVISSDLKVSGMIEKNKENLANLDELREENMNLLNAAKKFKSSLSTSLSLLGVDTKTIDGFEGKGDLSSFFGEGKNEQEYSMGETVKIKALTKYLEGAVKPIEQIGDMLEAQGTFFKEIPNIWPVINANAHISMMFGPNVHPITGQWYIHKGIDFSTGRSGDAVVATANGQVVTVGFDLSFGNFIIIRHKHGIYTRYAHLSVARVRRGQFVDQGEIIGNIGNTGVTTAPHLHYEVHIGPDVVDPGKYINVKISR